MLTCTTCLDPLPPGAATCSRCGTPADVRRDLRTADGSAEIARDLRDRLGARFELEREIGRGGMGIVFLARQKCPQRRVAIKILRPEKKWDLEVAQRFAREGMAQGRLSHPGIVPVYEAEDGEAAGGMAYVVTPFVDGPSLRGLLARDPRCRVEEVVRFLREVGDALRHAHEHGVVHRDVKPENILLDARERRFQLTDFGIAKITGGADCAATRSGGSLGTPSYMAPEQAAGSRALDGRADQYALGLIAWEMLAGRKAFDSPNPIELIYQHQFELPPDIAEVRPDCPGALAESISRAIAKSPDDRFPDMAAFLCSLASGADGPPPAARPRPAVARTDRRNVWLAASAASAAVCALLLVLAGASRSSIEGRGGRHSVFERFQISSAGDPRPDSSASARTDTVAVSGDLAAGPPAPTRDKASARPTSAASEKRVPAEERREERGEERRGGKVPAAYEEALRDLRSQTPGYPPPRRSSTSSPSSTTSIEAGAEAELEEILRLLLWGSAPRLSPWAPRWDDYERRCEAVGASSRALAELRAIVDRYPSVRGISGSREVRWSNGGATVVVEQEAWFGDEVSRGRLRLRLEFARSRDGWSLTRAQAAVVPAH